MAQCLNCRLLRFPLRETVVRDRVSPLGATCRRAGRNPFELKKLSQVVFVEDLALDALLGTACFLVRSP